jgi:perosamine synthetase
VKRKITTNTKAVIAVHNYGHPADMLALKEICEQANIYLVEDAAPGIGSRIDDTLVGTFGDISCFSFQGAKPIVTGEGGMLTTDNPELFERAYYYWDHCRDTSKVLYNTDVGLKYKMSNIQAALGLAQLERIDEIIGKRRQIFAWYEERLGDLEGINMNVERPGIYSNFYVPTIVLNEKSNQSPDKVMQFLNDNGVMNRPFFRCISKMMPQYNEAVTPIADKIVPRGINLPCASILSEDDVDYSAKIIREALCQ